MKRRLRLLVCLLLTSVGMWAETLVDITSILTNAAVSDGTGWTNPITANDANWTGAPENVCLNHGWYTNTTDMYQEVSLPAGVYKLTVMTRGHSEISSNIYVYDPVNSRNFNSAEITKRGDAGDNNGWGETVVYFALGAEQSVRIGWWCENTNGSTGRERWANADYFKLYSVSLTPNTDLTMLLVNPSFETGDKSGWTDDTSGNDKFFIQTNKELSGLDGEFYAERYWGTNTSDLNQTTPTLLPGFYTITALAHDKGKTFSLYAKVGNSEEKQVSVSEEAQNHSVEVYLSNPANIKFGFKGEHKTQEWAAIDNFRLSYLGNPYAALNDAISTAEGHTLGFDAGEYAPYTNVEALTRLASAKSIYDAKTATYAEVVAAKEALESATWTANDVEKDAVYNGNMAVADGTNPKGWDRQNDGWGKQVDSSGEKDHDFSKTTNNTAWYYNNNNSSYYGETDYYTMPLKASTTYLLRVKYCSQGTGGGGLVTSLKATVKKGSTVVLDARELGENRTQIFEEKSVTFTTTDAGNYVLELKNTGNFYFTDVSILKTATAADYAALNAAIAAHTPGFEVGEYAPYTNVDAMVALATAKAIDQETANLKSDVQNATNALTGATWTVNTELMDAIYDGQFASYTEDELNKSFKENGIKFPGGWLHDNSAVSTTDHIRQIATFSSFEGGRAMFFHPRTVSYGQTTGYTMPLRANAVYKFSFQYAGWSGYGTNPPSISILNENNEGMALTALPEGASAPGSGSTRYTVYFATDATPGNYIFKYQSPDDTNSTIGDLSLIRVDALPFSASGSINYLPGTYSKVSVDRPMSSGTWNTLVIPVDMAIPGEWTVKEMDNFSESTLTFKNASSIVAGTPYLVKTTETIDNIIASDVEVKALSVVNNITKNGLTMKGVYANGTVPVSDGLATRYVVSGDYMYRVNSTVSIKPFRAYFELEGGNNAREIILNFNDDFTAINAIDVAENEFGAQKDGKYLIDGKIVIVKNGVKYGTNGQKLN